MTERARFHPVRPVRAYERIVEQIEQAIVGGELTTGQRLPSERDLMEQFSVSRSTVREALRVLESNALIRSRPGDPNGAEVLGFSPGVLRGSVHRLARANGLKLTELIQFRMMLEGSANLLAARLRTEEQLAEMEKALDSMRAAVDRGNDAFSEADIAFHEVVAQASGNAMIQVCSDVARGVVLDLIATKIAGAADSTALMLQSLQHHTDVFAAVRAGDGPGAARTARSNLYEYYAGYVPESDRPLLRMLVDGGEGAEYAPTGRTSRPGT